MYLFRGLPLILKPSRQDRGRNLLAFLIYPFSPPILEMWSRPVPIFFSYNRLGRLLNKRYTVTLILKNFLGESKNKDHVSCFSIWWGGGMARNFFKSQSLYRGGDVYHYELTCYVLTARISHLPKHSHF